MSKWTIDAAHSTAGFSVKHMMIAKVHGAFDRFEGRLTLDEADITRSAVEVTIEADSINTRETKRDEHLRSEDFFDVAHHPRLTFRSTAIRAGADGGLVVAGDLSIRGITRSVELEVERPSEETKDPWGNVKIGLSGRTKIKRKDFGLTWNAALEAGGVLVGDDVTIDLEIQLTKQND